MDSAFLLFIALPIVCVGGTFVFFRRRQPTNRLKLVVGNALMLACFLSVGFALAETYFRFIYDTTESSTSTLTSQAWYRRHWQTNSSGYRDINWPPTVPGKRRLFILGDSFAAGYGIKDVQNRFANIIRARHPDWYLYIMAYPGVDTLGETAWLTNLFVPGEHYEQDTFLLIYNLNDVTDIVGDEWGEGVIEIANDPFRQSWLCRNSYFVNLYYNRWQQSHNPKIQGIFHELAEGYESPKWELQADHLRQLQGIIESHGAKLLVVTFPDLHALGKDYCFQKGHERLSEFWKTERIPYLDLLPFFQDRDPRQVTVNRHDAHPNEFAHRIAADAIDKFLIPEMLPGGSAAAASLRR
jgi:hypothetical protein